jgi:hypothetical protein
MGVLFGYLGITLLLIFAIGGPLAVGRRLSDRQRALEDAEVAAERAAIEASALALLAGVGAGSAPQTR